MQISDVNQTRQAPQRNRQSREENNRVRETRRPRKRSHIRKTPTPNHQIENYINEQGKVKVFDVLCTMCDQLKGRIKAVESFGVTDDLASNVYAIIYASQRLDISELSELGKIFKGQMSTVLYREAVAGVAINPTIKENVDYIRCEEGETYLKLNEICAKNGEVLYKPEEWKQSLREYCYRTKKEMPLSCQDSLDYNPSAASANAGGQPPSAQPPAGGYAPPPSTGYQAPPPGYTPPPAGGYQAPPAGYIPPQTYPAPTPAPTPAHSVR